MTPDEEKLEKARAALRARRERERGSPGRLEQRDTGYRAQSNEDSSTQKARTTANKADDITQSEEDPSLEELGVVDKAQEEELMCNNCGHTLQEPLPKQCPNCQEEFDNV